MVSRYMVMGGHFGSMAHLQVIAASKEQAEAEYRKYFGDRILRWLRPSIIDLAERPDMEEFWKGHMDSHFSEGY